jgi:diaminopimelate decarboxylase
MRNQTVEPHIISRSPTYIRRRPLFNYRARSIPQTVKTLPFDEQTLKRITDQYPTPFHLYDEAGMRATAKALGQVYDWSPDYQNYFAVKANPNPYLMEILKDEGMGADASSLPELRLAEVTGTKRGNIIFTSNNTPIEEYKKARELGATINLDDINQIEVVEAAFDGGFPQLISFRYNPGHDIVLNGVSNSIGNPVESKFGVTTEQLPRAYRLAQEKGATRFGLHTMVVTNERDERAMIAVARLMFETAVRINRAMGIKLEFIDLGGGLGIPYRQEDRPIDLEALRDGIKTAYEDTIVANGLAPMRIITEDGRFVMAPNGYLITKVRSLKRTYHNFVGLDATSADLLRACVYGLYHHVTVPGKEDLARIPQRLTGSMCENNDTLTGPDDRMLPELLVGDTVVFHDTGAHGHALGYNYNAKLRHAELLLKMDGSIQEIRRAQTMNDYFETLAYPGL